MTEKEPNVFELIQRRDKKALIELITKAFRQGAAEGHRQTLAVRAAMAAFSGSNARALEFLRTPHPALDDKVPMKLAGASDEGLAEVERLIEQHRD